MTTPTIARPHCVCFVRDMLHDHTYILIENQTLLLVALGVGVPVLLLVLLLALVTLTVCRIVKMREFREFRYGITCDIEKEWLHNSPLSFPSSPSPHPRSIKFYYTSKTMVRMLSWLGCGPMPATRKLEP